MSEQAVIETGGKQYLVKKGDKLSIEKIVSESKKIDFEPMLIINSDHSAEVGKPFIVGKKVRAEIIEEAVKDNKVTSIRFKAKKRVKVVRGHRQVKSIIEVLDIK